MILPKKMMVEMVVGSEVPVGKCEGVREHC